MSAGLPLTVHPQARARAGMSMQTPTDKPAASLQGKANCGACGKAWFGEVAFCPYCGRRAASMLAHAAADETPNEPAPASQAIVPPALKRTPRSAAAASRWKVWWKPIVAVAAALAVVVIAVQQFKLTPGDTATAQDAAPVLKPATPPAPPPALAAAPAPVPATASMSAPPTLKSSPPASTTHAPVARPVAPPAPNRSLCSVANEAAGLCNPR